MQRRRAGARHPGAASVDGALHRDKLARRFVSDAPPPALVDRAGGAVPRDRRRPARGDAHARSRRRSFSSPDAYRAKVKTPFEFVVSAVRATGADGRGRAAAGPRGAASSACRSTVPAADRLQGHRRRLGRTPARSSNRMNFALALASDKVRGIVGRDRGRAGRWRRVAELARATISGRHARDDREGGRRRAAEGRAGARVAGIPAALRIRTRHAST